MTDFILTEKYSVAADFAKALGIKTRKEGFFEGDTCVITWAVGHLVELYAPDDYDPGLKKWRMETLPLIPDTFRYKPIKSGRKQFNVIKKLVRQPRFSRIIIATDAGREGEVIARTILFQCGAKDKQRMFRFWTSQALVPRVVRHTLDRLSPITDYDRLWRAGYYRQVADWLVGMNLTRALTVRLGDLFSVGRVQTAVLALLVTRKKERDAFVPEPFWLLKVVFTNDKGTWTGLWFNKKQTRITDKEKAEALFRHLKKETGSGTVLSMTREKKKEPPPLLFSLTDLQQAANARLGFPAKKTLAIAQTLYQDKKCLSYPRTDARVLGTTSLDLVQTVIEKCSSAFPDIFAGVVPDLVSLSNKRVFNDAKLTDHHALIPFKPLPAGATPDEKKVFDLVCRRFAAAFHPHCHFENTHVITGFAGETFQTRGRVILDPGWRRVYHMDIPDKGGETETVPLPALVKGDMASARKVTCEEKKTTPPPVYSDALLLKEMTNPGRYVSQTELKKLYRGEIGIGTQSTRAQIIETLIERHYVTRSGRQLLATDKGVFLIEQLKKCTIAAVLTSPEETARWEMTLNAVAQGQAPDGRFLNDIKTFVTRAVAEMQTRAFDIKSFSQPSATAPEVGKCPACGSSVRERQKGYACEKTGCDFIIWKRMAGKRISPKMASHLLRFRKSGPFSGFVSKKKKRFSAGLAITRNNDKWQVTFDFNASQNKSTPGPAQSFPKTPTDRSGTPVPDMTAPVPVHHSPVLQAVCCPVCRGAIIEGRTAFGCANWRPEHGNCRFVIWKTILEKRLTEKNIQTLLQGQKTRAWVFQKDGQKFKAALKLAQDHEGEFALKIIPHGTDLYNMPGDIPESISCVR